MFMFMLPVFQRRFRTAICMLAIVLAGLILPDLIKPAPGTGDLLSVPAHVLPRDGVVGEKHFALIPTTDTVTAYLDEYLSLTLTNGGPSWWEDRSNPFNQSITRILLYHSPVGLDARIVFLGLCLLFSGSLMLLARVHPDGEGLAVTGLLFYSAFVLIGPVSSKPHFVMLYGLFTFAWLDLSRHFRLLKLLFLLAAGIYACG